jgi:hypothetical protein
MLEVRDHLEQAQQHHKDFYDHKHQALEFEVGEWVWLRLLHRPIASLDVQGRGKLGPKFYGPFKVLERIGEVAYHLQLLAGAKLHNAFHVGLMKKFIGEPPSVPGILPPMRHGRVCLEPAEVIKGRLACGRWEILVCWTGQAAVEASWVELDEFKRLYPSCKLVDELNF